MSIISNALKPCDSDAHPSGEEDIISPPCNQVTLQDETREQHEINLGAHSQNIQTLRLRLESLKKAKEEHDNNISEQERVAVDLRQRLDRLDADHWRQYLQTKRLEGEKKYDEEDRESLALIVDHVEKDAAKLCQELASMDEELARKDEEIARNYKELASKLVKLATFEDEVTMKNHLQLEQEKTELSAEIDQLFASIQQLQRDSANKNIELIKLRRQVEEYQQDVNILHIWLEEI